MHVSTVSKEAKRGRRPKEGVGIPEAGVTGNYGPPGGSARN